MMVINIERKKQRIKRSEWEQNFASILENERHSLVLVQMARGAFELHAAMQGGEVVLGGGADDYDRTSDDTRYNDEYYYILNKPITHLANNILIRPQNNL
jgi:hypothetical protein